MTFKVIECFFAAVETLNFTIAAQNVHITQQAFSRNISLLEQELGFSLFFRSKQNGLRVTPAGAEFYRGMKELKADFELLKERAARISLGEEGTLVIGLLIGLCIDSITMEKIAHFQRTYPHIEVNVISYQFKDILRSVEQGESDMCFAIQSAVGNNEKFLSEELFEIDIYLAVPSRLHCDTNREYSLSEFKDEYFILSKDAPELNRLFLEGCKRAGFEAKTKLAPNFETKMLWVEFGQGVAVHSKEHYIKNSPNVDFVMIREIKYEAYSMVWARENHNPAIALFYSMYEN